MHLFGSYRGAGTVSEASITSLSPVESGVLRRAAFKEKA
jgi:hypothetical protein